MQNRGTSRLRNLRETRDRSLHEAGFSDAANLSHTMAFYEDWVVHRDYSVVDGLLVPHGGITRKYFPAGTPDIIQRFQKLAMSHDTDPDGAIVSFARQWGHLGHDEFFSHEPEKKRDGDPVEWIVNHSRDVNMVLLLVQLARAGDENQISNLLEPIYSFLYGAPDPDQETFEMFGRPGIFWTKDRVEEYSEQLQLADGMNRPNSSRHAISIAVGIISKHVSNIKMSASVDEDGLGIHQWFTFEALVDVIWWHTLELTTGSISPRLCPGCGSIFKPTRSNQIYCPRPSDSYGTASLCSGRYRTRKQREKLDLEDG